MKRHFILFSLFFCFISCSDSKTEIGKKQEFSIYKKEGVTFKLPLGWKVQKDTMISGEKVLELNKYSNYSVSTTIGITFKDKSILPDTIVARELKKLDFFYHKVNFDIKEKNKPLKIAGKHEVQTTSYEADDTRSKVYGMLFVIPYQTKNIYVQIVENDSINNTSDYDLILGSLEIK